MTGTNEELLCVLYVWSQVYVVLKKAELPHKASIRTVQSAGYYTASMAIFRHSYLLQSRYKVEIRKELHGGTHCPRGGRLLERHAPDGGVCGT